MSTTSDPWQGVRYLGTPKEKDNALQRLWLESIAVRVNVDDVSRVGERTAAKRRRQKLLLRSGVRR